MPQGERTASHVGDGTGNRASRGDAAENGVKEIPRFLRHQLLIRIVAILDHAVGHARKAATQ